MAKGDVSDPTWAYVQVALAFGAQFALGKGYPRWTGGSCYVVAALALAAVIKTRNGEAIGAGPRAGQYLIPTDNPRDIHLAYCDHYVHMRGEAARMGPHGRWKLETQTRGYDAAKRFIAQTRDLPDGGWTTLPGTTYEVSNSIVSWMGKLGDRALREGSAPLSAPTKESLYWGLEGIEDGLKDYEANPGIDNDPSWFGSL